MERRRLYALVLSAVILPTILLASFHHHESVQGTHCVDCSHHIPHGHLGIGHSTDDCLVCQFLSIAWLTSSEAPEQVPVQKPETERAVPSVDLAGRFVPSLSSRAPPAVFC